MVVRDNRGQSTEGVLLVRTRRIEKVCLHLGKIMRPRLDGWEVDLVEKLERTEVLTLGDAMRLGRILRRVYATSRFTVDGEEPPLCTHSLLRGSRLVPEKEPEPTPNPELQARLARLRAEQANNEYARMVRGVTETKRDRWAKDTRELHGYFSQLSIGLNIIVSMATTLTAGYWIGRWYEYKPAVAVAMGLSFMIVVLLAEVWLFIIRAERLHDRMRKEEKKRKQLNMKVVNLAPSGNTTRDLTSPPAAVTLLPPRRPLSEKKKL